MIQAELTRYHTDDTGTEGVFVVPDLGFVSHTLELPWRDNRPNISCIPVGTYICKQVVSPRFGTCYQVMDVEGRTHVLHHAGNLAGDKAMGYKSHVAGCILHGLAKGLLGDQKAVLNSKRAIYKMNGS